MARADVVKARKVYVCSKCLKEIQKGDEYVRGIRMYGKGIIRCRSCGIQSWELSSSQYILDVCDIVEGWRKKYVMSNSIQNEIADDLESIKESAQERFDNIPDNLICSQNAIALEARIDSLDDTINELCNIDDSKIILRVLEEAGVKEVKKGILEYGLSDLTNSQQERYGVIMGEKIDEALSMVEL